MTPTPPSAERDVHSSGRTTRRLVLRSVKLPAALAASTLILALSAFGVIAWRGMQHLEPVDRHLSALTRLQQTGLRLEEIAVKDLNGGDTPPQRMEALRQEVDAIIALDSHLSPETPHRLALAQAALADLKSNPRQSLLAAIGQIRKVLAAEILAHGELVAGVRRNLALDFIVISVAVTVLVVLALMTLIRMRKRVFAPLAMLEQLLMLTAKRNYSLASTDGVDPIVLPLTTSYNHLVQRLIELEDENARHRDTLEQEVRTVTEALLEQHRNLAAAERLAAAGEVAARIAHELRNPLAGMQMALSNIRTECDDSDVIARMDLVIDELRRVTGLLNGLLDQSRISPEPATDLPIGKTVDDLLAIVRYQIPKTIQLRKSIPEDLVCHLPKDRVRQVLLNLILNSADAIGERSGEIVVRAAAVDNKLDLSVCDNGPGFPEDLLRDGIGPFRTARSGGTGLGLSIVSRLVHNLDGQIELHNLDPNGACARLTLPCRGANA